VLTLYLQFKTKYDLIGGAFTSEGSSRRTTRRAHQDRVEKLKGALVHPSPTVSTSRVKTASPPPQDDGTIWDILGFSAKGKGKERESRSPKTTKGKALSVTPGEGVSLATTHEHPSVLITDPKVTRKSKSRASLHKMPPSSTTPSGPREAEKEQLAAGKVRRRQSPDPISNVPPAAPRKRRKTDLNTHTDLQNSTSTERPAKITRSRSSQLTPPSFARKATLNGVHESLSHKLSPGLLADQAKPSAPNTPTSTIKRIKLIVRAPDPVYTNPKQKPTPPLFNKSVTSALASYTRLESDDISEDALENAAQKDAVLLEHVYALRQQGRMLLSAEDAACAVQIRPTERRIAGSDPWDHILDAVRARYRHRETSGPEIAATIAAKVRTYWDLQNAKEGKVRVQQEKQLRALAKTTIKLVIAEWKKTVFVSDLSPLTSQCEVGCLDGLLGDSIYGSRKGLDVKKKRRARAASILMRYWISLARFWKHSTSICHVALGREADPAAYPPLSVTWTTKRKRKVCLTQRRMWCQTTMVLSAMAPTPTRKTNSQM
jgi:helicase SWR1